MVKLLFLSGSTRTGSYNTQLLEQAAILAQKNGKATVTTIALRNFSMPLYDGDLEEKSGLPPAAQQLKKLFIEHDGLFITSPEYNSSFSPLLKNSLDWVSRKSSPNEQDLMAFRGKVVALASASPGQLGGLRGLVPLRLMLGNMHVLVLPMQLSIPGAQEAFLENGQLKSETHQRNLEQLVDELIRITHHQKMG